MLISGSLSFFFLLYPSPSLSLPLIRYPFNNSVRSLRRWMSRPRRSLCAHTRLRLPLWINYGGRSKEHATTKPVMQRVVRIQKARLVFGLGRGLRESEICISSCARSTDENSFFLSSLFISYSRCARLRLRVWSRQDILISRFNGDYRNRWYKI